MCMINLKLRVADNLRLKQGQFYYDYCVQIFMHTSLENGKLTKITEGWKNEELIVPRFDPGLNESSLLRALKTKRLFYALFSHFL